MTSIRRELVVGLLIGLWLLVAAGSGVLYLSLRAVMIRQFDEALLTRARALASLVQQSAGGGFEFNFADESLPGFSRGSRPDYFEIRRPDGTVLERSRSLAGKELMPTTEDHPGPGFRNLVLPDGRAGREVRIEFHPQRDDENEPEGELQAEPPTGAGLVLVLARGREELDGTLNMLLVGIAALGLLLPLGIALVVGMAVRRGLRPLERIAAETAAVDPRRLDYRFKVNDVPEELKPVCEKLNDLLIRLETAFARERRFTADVAHELRTPVAELRSLAEVARMDDGDAVLTRRVLTETVAITQQMENLVNSLLTLSRCDAGIQSVLTESVPLAEAVEKAWSPFRHPAAEKELAVSLDLTGSPGVDTDPGVLQAILTNLFANAVEYSPPGGRLYCGIETGDSGAAVVIENTAADLEPADLDVMGDRFWRKDAARSDSAHSGLGLSLVRAYCELLGARLDLSLADGPMLRVVVAFPISGSENPTNNTQD